MANQKSFAVTPSVSISRSKFKRPSQHKTAFNLGDLIPIYVDLDILPGDTVSMDLASLVRMSTPIAPIMDNIYIDYYAMFVPNRLIDDTWKQFMGENTSSYGAATDPGYPVCDIVDATRGCAVGSIGDYMGLPDLSAVSSSTANTCEVSALAGRAYISIWNEWFRDQNLISPIALNTGVGNSKTYPLGVDPNNSSANLWYSMKPLKVAKASDYFTRALPYAQKGAPVTLPLGGGAPVVSIADLGGDVDDVHTITSPIFGNSTDIAGGSTDVKPLANRGVNGLGLGGTGSGYSTNVNVTNLMADLSNATAATINQLRFAFQYQKFLEKDALYGTRYWEILKGHFAISAPDASLQRPEYLGHYRQAINVDQVLQTTGIDISTPSNNTLGATGANSFTGGNSHLFSKSFVEHGVLMVVACARHDQTYGQGINRMWSRRKRTDFYFPVFANLGAQEILKKEIFASGTDSTDKLPFGFQECWAEYRYRPSQISSILKPSVANSLGYWTLANNFASAPTLSKSFIEQDRDNLARALVTGNTGPDFIADFYFDATYVRPMPVYSIPGLVDHH